MITSLVIQAYFDILRTTAPGLPLLPRYFFNPESGFSDKMKSYIVAQDQAVKENQGSRYWMLISWNRSPVNSQPETTQKRRIDVLDRNYTDPNNPKGNKYKYGMVGFELAVEVYAPSIDLLELLEEYLLIYPTREFDFQYLGIFPGSFKASVIAGEPSSLAPVSVPDHGTLCVMAFSANVIYPLVRSKDPSEYKLIKYPHLDLYFT